MAATPRLHLQYLLRHLRHGWVRVIALVIGVVIAVGGSLVLGAATTTSAAEFRGVVEDTPRSAYDILVRPRGSQQGLEARDGLVRPNFLGGQYGGITLTQWNRIPDLPGVEVAAPVANVGFVLPYTSIFVPVSQIPHEPGDLVRLNLSWQATAGTASYPGSRPLVFFAANEEDCNGLQFYPPRTATGPYDVQGPANVYLMCIPPGALGSVQVDVIFPLLIAGIDPVQESLIAGLSNTIVDGRMLEQADGWTQTRFGPSVRVVASSRTYTDQSLSIAPEVLDPPDQLTSPELLRSPNAFALVEALSGSSLTPVTYAPDDLYERVLTDLEASSNASESFSAYWHIGHVTYSRDHNGLLRPEVVEQNPGLLWRDGQGSGGYAPVPPANQDVALRSVTQHRSTPRRLGVGSAELNVLGRFDPELLPGSDPMSEVPLETYLPPRADPADRATS